MDKLKGMMFFTLVVMLMALSCSGPKSDQPVLTAELPIHLEEHLDAARIIGSEIPEEIPAPVEWRFDEPQPDWKPVVPLVSAIKPVQVTYTEDALRLVLTEASRDSLSLVGGIYIDLPDWNIDGWGYVFVTARAKGNVRHIRICFNLAERAGKQAELEDPQRLGFIAYGDNVDAISDSEVHTYLLKADWSRQEWEGPWKQLVIYTDAFEPSNIDILSVTVVPKEHIYAGASTGVGTGIRSDAYRQTPYIVVNNDYRRILYTHAPGRIEYRIRIPQAGRLDVGLGVLRKNVLVTFRITAKSKGSEVMRLLEETYADKEHWAQRSVDLSSMSGQVVTLALEADANRQGSVALWAAPTITGTRFTKKPNIIFYVIDGAGADYMSLYGYNRRTTPHLERLATEGAVFEYAYSNSSWTKPSTMSFMTSLHCSVLGGLYSRTDPLPEQAVTMAQHLHRAGYQTSVLVNNSYAAQLSGLERDVDWLREATVSDNTSSVELHQYFLNWREAYPGQPYWVHFQTSDVHSPHMPVAPFAGLYIDPKLRESFFDWDNRVRDVARLWTKTAIPFHIAMEKTGVDRLEYFRAAIGLYAEAMAHQDYQIGKLVERLKTAGDWENTLLIIASDHGREQGAGPLLDPLPPRWSTGFNSHTSRIPLIFVWPGHIDGGQRFTDAVSMIDVLPTILDLIGLPMPEVMQGQSLAPLLLKKKGWEPKPVIFDEFRVESETKELYGHIGMIDGRWGVSMAITPDPGSKFTWGTREFLFERSRPSQVLLFDVWNDPYTLHSLHEEHPDLVKKYTEILKKKWMEHRELGKLFTRSSELPLNREQLETLRSLGYIR